MEKQIKDGNTLSLISEQFGTQAISEDWFELVSTAA